MKNSPLFYEVRDAVENGAYLKISTRILQKYIAELSLIQPWESDPSCWAAVQRKHEWIFKIKSEIQRRKDRNRSRVQLMGKAFLKYIVAPVLVIIIAFFVLRPFQKVNPIKAKPIIDLCHRGISVITISDAKVNFDIPYCSGKNANAYNVKLETAIIFKTDNALKIILPYGDKFPDNITLTYETGKSISYTLHPFNYDLNNIYIAVRGTYTNEDGSLIFPVLDIFKYSSTTKNWVRTLGDEDKQVRVYLQL